jgi:hypothetical protein
MNKISVAFTAGIAGVIAGAAVLWLFMNGSAGPAPKTVLVNGPKTPQSMNQAEAQRQVRVQPRRANAARSGEPPIASERPELAPDAELEISATDRVASMAEMQHFHVPSTKDGNTPQFLRVSSKEVAVPPAQITEALSYALEAAEPNVKQGFTIREDFWGGALAPGESKPIVQQLFKGNEYWFWMGAMHKGATVSVHIYDGAGNIAENESWQRGNMAAARVNPKRTGTYYLIVEVKKSSGRPGKVPWGMAYGYR